MSGNRPRCSSAAKNSADANCPGWQCALWSLEASSPSRHLRRRASCSAHAAAGTGSRARLSQSMGWLPARSRMKSVFSGFRSRSGSGSKGVVSCMVKLMECRRVCCPRVQAISMPSMGPLSQRCLKSMCHACSGCTGFFPRRRRRRKVPWLSRRKRWSHPRACCFLRLMWTMSLMKPSLSPASSPVPVRKRTGSFWTAPRRAPSHCTLRPTGGTEARGEQTRRHASWPSSASKRSRPRASSTMRGIPRRSPSAAKSWAVASSSGSCTAPLSLGISKQRNPRLCISRSAPNAAADPSPAPVFCSRGGVQYPLTRPTTWSCGAGGEAARFRFRSRMSPPSCCTTPPASALLGTARLNPPAWT
mmetsp:Transcript_59332/g.167131  ORF Transcript_59332/g.167131 Transcript_59332/m.167131 type:complete len:360 (+) Transcript_59332:833-1912(+)